jgi:hypothetical protein
MSTHTILTRHLDATLPLAAAAAKLLESTQTNPLLDNLYVDDSATGLLRIGGPDLRGDILIRLSADKEGAVLAHFRQGDRPVFRALVAATEGGWTVRRRQPASTEGLDLLEFIQDAPRLGRCRKIQFSETAAEDALGCSFDEIDLLIRFLVELEVHGDDEPALDDTPEGHEPSLEAVRKSLAGTERIILHRGRRLVLRRREVIEGRRNDLNLIVHYARLPRGQGYVIGGLAEEAAA